MHPYQFLSQQSFTEPSFLDPFLSENEFKKDSTKSFLDIHGDASQFLSPSMLSSFDVGLEQMFQPLIDESSIPTTNELLTPSTFHVEPDQYFNQEVLQNVYMEVPQEQHQHASEEDQTLEDEQDHESAKKEISPERKWFTSYSNQPLVGEGDVEISLKTRREKPTSLVPERLYSSLKYELQITATGEFVRSVPFLLARISVVDAKTFEPISKNNKAVTKGENESALTHPPNGPGNIIKGTIKVQFDSSISYHHDKREVRLEMNFFMNEALDQPILTKRTVPVKMFARKPNKKHNKNEATAPSTKRKREADVKEEAQPAKVAKVLHQAQQFQLADFEKRLDSLVESSVNLSYEDRQRATGLILSKFGLLQFVLATSDPFNHQFQ